MIRSVRAAGTLAPLLAAAAVLAACSSDGGSGSPSSPAPSVPSSSAPSSSAPTSSDPSSSAPSSESSSSGDDDALEPALLPASEIGSGYERTVSDTGDRDPLPCTPNDPPVVQQVPPQQYLGATYRRSDQNIQVTENVFVFADDATAQRYVDAAKKGLSCSSARIDGATYKISGGGDFPTTTDADDSAGWDLATNGFVGTLAVVRLDDTVVAFTFVARQASASELQPRPIVDKAVTRVDETL